MDSGSGLDFSNETCLDQIIWSCETDYLVRWLYAVSFHREGVGGFIQPGGKGTTVSSNKEIGLPLFHRTGDGGYLFFFQCGVGGNHVLPNGCIPVQK